MSVFLLSRQTPNSRHFHFPLIPLLTYLLSTTFTSSCLRSHIEDITTTTVRRGLLYDVTVMDADSIHMMNIHSWSWWFPLFFQDQIISICFPIFVCWGAHAPSHLLPFPANCLHMCYAHTRHTGDLQLDDHVFHVIVDGDDNLLGSSQVEIIKEQNYFQSN